MALPLWPLERDAIVLEKGTVDADPYRLGKTDTAFVCFWQIVLKKFFFAGDGKFSGPLVRLSCCEVRDHMNYRKTDRRPSYRFYSCLQRQKSPNGHDRSHTPIGSP